MNRRRFLKSATLAAVSPAVLPLIDGPALGQPSWPTRNLKMIVPFPPGGQADFAARPMAAALEKIFGHAVVVENRAAGGSTGNAIVARAAPDGYTVLTTVSSFAVLPEADRLDGRKPAYEVSELFPLARILADPTLLAVPTSAPWQSIGDFVEDAKKRPGLIAYGSSGPYGALHVATEMFATSAGIKLLHVPFRGAGPALTGILSGTVQVLASAPGVLKPQVDAGRLRVLANWGAKRIDSFPNIPTFKELGYGDVEFYLWAGMFVPLEVQNPVIARLREAVSEAINSSDVVRVFNAAGSPPAYLDAPEFAKFLETDNARLIAAVLKMGKLE